MVPPRPNLFSQPPPVHGAGGMTVPEQPPNQILFLTNLPDETSEMMLSMLFTQSVSLFFLVGRITLVLLTLHTSVLCH